jgi:hypothetical protein
MEEKKVVNSELIRPRRTMELREFALAAFYPQTHSGSAAHRKLTEDKLPVIPAPPRSRLRESLDPPRAWRNPGRNFGTFDGGMPESGRGADLLWRSPPLSGRQQWQHGTIMVAIVQTHLLAAEETAGMLTRPREWK